MKKSLFLPVDWNLLVPVAVLASISLTTIYSLNKELFFSHGINFLLAFITFLIFSQVDYRLFRPLAKPIYFVSLALLAIVFILGIESRGAIRWIYIFGVSFQFSELLKPFLTLSLAAYLAGGTRNTPKGFLSIFVLLAPVVFLISLQPDLGNGLVYLGAMLLTLFTYGYPMLWFVLLSLPFVLLSPLLWSLMHDYQKQRILTFIHPGSDPLGTSYNVVQAIIAVGAGRIIGRGVGEGTQSGLRFLPERHTDFIFATISEGYGLIGAGIVVVCFVYILYRIYVVHLRSEDNFAKIFCAGAFFFILIQFFVNIGMNVGILPVVGITLPFVSYGGSSLISTAIFLGIVSAIARESLREKVLEIR